MADRRMDNGREGTRPGQRPGVPEDGAPGAQGGTELPRRGADVSPPGSRERAEADISGYSPERDEEPSLRQGRFHRAAQMRLAQPRTSLGMEAGMDAGLPARGPYGQDDRDDRSATGLGRSEARMGEPETRHSLELRRDTGGENYRPWDRTGYGPEERGQYTRERYDPLLGMGQASPGEPGLGVNVGERETYTARSPIIPPPTHHPRHTRLGGLLRRRWQREPLTAREIMTRGVRTARRDSPLREVAHIMKEEDCGVVPIVDERGTLAGIVTDRDLVIRAFTGGRVPDQLRAGDVMTDEVECVHPEESIHSIIELMGKRQIRRIPVVERDDRLIGIISMADIAHRADYDEELQEALDRISSKRSFWSRLT